MSASFSESVLLRQAIAGDRAALSQILLLYYDDLQRHVARRLSHASVEAVSTEDILQQTFVRAALAVARFAEQPEGSFRGWLFTIAANLVRDAQKRRHREQRAAKIPESMAHRGSEFDDRSGAGVDRLVADTTSPSMNVHRRDSARSLNEALAALPAEQREVIQRHYLHDQTWEQVAEEMGRTKEAVRGICYRARRSLRSALGHSSWFCRS